MPALRSREKRCVEVMLQSTSAEENVQLESSHSDAPKTTLSNKRRKTRASVRDHDDHAETTVSLPSAANITPPEILHQIYSMLTPRDFDNARRTCSQWMRASLDPDLLERMLKRAGWWDAWQQDRAVRTMRHSEESEVWRMSRRFSTECLLSGRKANIERPGFVKTGIVDFSGLERCLQGRKTRRTASLSKRPFDNGSTFSVSSCSRYVLVTAGCMIHVFRLLGKISNSLSLEALDHSDLVPVTSISCPYQVLSATLDTSTPRFLIAALLSSRVGMVCDIDVSSIDREGLSPTIDELVEEASTSPTSKPARHNLYSMPTTSPSSAHYYHNVCSEDHPPRTVALYPGRRCVAFGCAGGIEIHWIDETTQTDQRRHFPMSQPSEILHFLPSSPESPAEMRLISSLAGPGAHECACRQFPPTDHPKKCPFNLHRDTKPLTRKSHTNTPSLSLVRATHCHHYRALPINDGYHIIFVEPRTGLLCIGSNAPVGGPTSLARAFVCIPPFGKDPTTDTSETHIPTAFAVGSDLTWGLRVVAAYQDRIVLYSIPIDIFNIIVKERSRQTDSIMGDSYPTHDWFINTEQVLKRRESLVQDQNGDLELLLGASYRTTAMMWPFKIYGKEIGRAENVVELALQSSNGGARIWAFTASGQASIFDIDTMSSSDGPGADDMPCATVNVGSDGSIDSAGLVKRAPSTGLSRKRKAVSLTGDFMGRYGKSRHVSHFKSDELLSTVTGSQSDESPVRRPSFAACIVDFKIPGLGIRDGEWKSGRALRSA